MQTNLFNKYQIIKFEPTGTLFEPMWYLAKKGYCPYCGHKLRKMIIRKGYICPTKKHKYFYCKEETVEKVVD